MLFRSKAGLYTLGNEEHQEDYVVRFQTIKESDGRLTTNMEGISDSGAKFLQRQKVKRTIRNLFMILAFILLVIEWIVYVRQMRYHGKFYWFVRGVVLLCVVLALFGIQIYRGSGKTATVFVVDFSNSNEDHLDEAQQYLQETISKMPSRNVYGIVTFGKDTLVEQFLTTEKHYGGLMTIPEKVATNFEEADRKSVV